MDATAIIEESSQVFTLEATSGKRPRRYKGFYISKTALERQGITVPERNAKKPILLLGGTSIPIEDRREFIGFLLESGYEVASIENPIGGPFDIGINPKRERPESLRDFMEYLSRSEQVEAIDIVAQSYSAFEVIRVLWADPVACKRLVNRVIFINPAGLNNNTGLLQHSFRFLWHHVLKGYAKKVGALLGFDNYPFEKNDLKKKDFIKREIQGLNSWSLKTFKNLVRTLREVHDIVTFRIEGPLRVLHEEYGYDFNLFIQTEDQLIPPRITLNQIKDLLPARNIRLAPGGHNDLFFQEWQRGAFLDFLNEVRKRT